MHRIFFQSPLLTICLLIGAAFGSRAATITNVTVVNVTPTSFSVLWNGAGGASLAVFADPNAATNITSRGGIEVLPVHTGNPDLPAGYARRQSQIAIRQKAQSYALMIVRVSGLQPKTKYYYQISIPSVSGPVTYPDSGPLPSVTTEQENTFVIDDQQLIVDVPGVDTLGQVITLTHTNAAHPLAALVGDGVSTNQVFFNLNDLFSLTQIGNIAPLGDQTFTLTVWDGKGPGTVAQFTVNFSLTFVSGGGNTGTFGTEFLALDVGSAILQVSQSTNVPISFNSSVGVKSVDLTLTVPPGRLSNLALTNLAAEVDPATITVSVQSASNVVLHLPARAGNLMLGAKQLAAFAFQATPGQSSAFVPLKVSQASATKSAGDAIANLSFNSGRLIIVGAEPLLEIRRPNNGNIPMTMYATPLLSYALEYTTNLGPNAVWKRLPPIGVTNLVTALSGSSGQFPNVFYRALRYTADPPYIEAKLNPDGSRYVMLFGKPGSKYLIQSAPTMSSTPSWSGVTNVPALTLPFTSVSLAKPGTVFLRAAEVP